MVASRLPVRLPVRPLVAVVAGFAILVSALMLERDRVGLVVERVTLAGTPVTLVRPERAEAPLPLVVVAHGYAGSRQMMRAFAHTLARSGLAVASYDALGHGRSARPLSGDLTSVEGATDRLVAQAVDVARVARARPGIGGPVALLGHSMATDVVIRAAGRLEDAAAVVAVSMYSEAVTPRSPDRLLILSGAREGRLRRAATEALRLVDADAAEGQTVASRDVLRRAVAIPVVGHVGVLYAPASLREARDWIAPALGAPGGGRPSAYGAWAALLLVATAALAWPLAALAGPPRPRPPPIGRRAIAAALLLPVPAALAAASLAPADVLGLRGFGTLAAVLAAWGAAQALALWGAGVRPAVPDPRGLAVLLGWGLLFALLLDRHGAAFLPTGPRLAVLALLLPGALAAMVAEAALARRLRWPWRLATRALLLATLLAAMALVPSLGVAFTALPVLVLFWLTYGLAGRWVARRAGAATAGVGLALALAWALAASTPLVAA